MSESSFEDNLERVRRGEHDRLEQLLALMLEERLDRKDFERLARTPGVQLLVSADSKCWPWLEQVRRELRESDDR